jgi:alpha-amylase
VFRVANVWMLAQPYGYPSILSSYAFDCPAGNAMGPPSDANGNTNDVTCASSLETATVGQWVCEHRDPYILNMVRFRRLVAGSGVDHWWDDGANAIAFSRGARGFVAINRAGGPLDTTVATAMAPGTYCDLLTGGLAGVACAGTTVVVDATDSIHITLPANSAIAVDIESQLPP